MKLIVATLLLLPLTAVANDLGIYAIGSLGVNKESNPVFTVGAGKKITDHVSAEALYGFVDIGERPGFDQKGNPIVEKDYANGGLIQAKFGSGGLFAVAGVFTDLDYTRPQLGLGFQYKQFRLEYKYIQDVKTWDTGRDVNAIMLTIESGVLW